MNDSRVIVLDSRAEKAVQGRVLVYLLWLVSHSVDCREIIIARFYFAQRKLASYVFFFEHSSNLGLTVFSFCFNAVLYVKLLLIHTFQSVNQPFLLHIESSLDGLGLLSSTHDQCTQRQSGQITLRVSQGHTSYKRKENLKISRSMVVEALSW